MPCTIARRTSTMRAVILGLVLANASSGVHARGQCSFEDTGLCKATRFEKVVIKAGCKAAVEVVLDLADAINAPKEAAAAAKEAQKLCLGEFKGCCTWDPGDGTVRTAFHFINYPTRERAVLLLQLYQIMIKPRWILSCLYTIQERIIVDPRSLRPCIAGACALALCASPSAIFCFVAHLL